MKVGAERKGGDGVRAGVAVVVAMEAGVGVRVGLGGGVGGGGGGGSGRRQKHSNLSAVGLGHFQLDPFFGGDPTY